MDIHSFKQDCAIEKIEFTQDGKKVWLARIFPRPGECSPRLPELAAELNSRHDGIIAVPQSDKNVHTLYASGFKSPNALLQHLKELGYTQGPATVEKLSKEGEEFSSKIRDASLRLAGVSYMVSDIAMTGAGLTSKPRSANLSTAGILYFLAGGLMSAFGRKDAHTHLKDLSLKMGDFFTQQGIDLPKTGPIAGANKERHSRIVEGLEQFAYSYPSQIFNTFVALCGVQLMRSGMMMRQRKEGGVRRDSFEIAAGGLVLGGALAGLLIPEKTGQAHLPRPGEEEKKPGEKTMLGQFWDWARERPLRIPGMLWFGNNVMMAFSALRERREDPKSLSYKFKFGYVAAAVLANALMFISSKQSNKRFDIDSDAMQAVVSVAASVVARQPKPVQEHIISQVSGFMASQPGMQHTAREIGDDIRAQVEGLAHNPFMASPAVPAASLAQNPATGWQQSVQASRGDTGPTMART